MTGKLEVILFAMLVVAGCASVPREDGFSQVQQLAHQRISNGLLWTQDTEADRQVAQAVANLLKNPLSLDSAVQIALLNNPDLQATYENLGISQADVVEAGLLENPTLWGSARFPDRLSSNTNLEFDIILNFLNLLMLPARNLLAGMQFERTKLQVAGQVYRLTTQVEAAYYDLLAAQQIQQVRQLTAQTARAGFEMARHMHSAGNISDLSLAQRQGEFEQVRLSMVESEVSLLEAREQLSRLMGLWGPQINWRMPAQLPAIPSGEPSLDKLESVAIAHRWDLAAARLEADVLAQTLGITMDWRWLGKAEIGVSSERDTDGQWVTGPNLAIQLPLFNRHQADISRLEAQLRQSLKHLASQAVAIRSEVRALRTRLVMKRYLVEHYQRVLLPLNQHIVHLTLQEYNYMLTGVFDLLAAKQQEYRNQEQLIEARRDYWVTRSELQRTLGTRLPESEKTELESTALPASRNDNDLKPLPREIHHNH